MARRIVVGISGATGAIYGIRTLEVLRQTDVETHLVMSEAAAVTIRLETDWSVEQVRALADVTHDVHNVGAAIASGSFATLGMVVTPCSIKTLSGIANSFNVNLLIRAADVTLKEGRRLVLMVRETPFHRGHLRLMLQMAEMGALIAPAIPSFYKKPRSIDDIVNQTVGRILDYMGIEVDLFQRWSEADGLKALEIMRQER